MHGADRNCATNAHPMATPPAPAPTTPPRPRWRRPVTWLWLALALPPLALVLLLAALALFGANWARGPIEQLVLQRTGRVLKIDGDLRLQPGWPLLGVQVQRLRFANPAWARQPQMVAVDTAQAQLDLRALLRGRVLLPQVQVGQPVVMLERAADGRRSWLLDRDQRDAGSAVQIGRLTLHQGTLGFDDPAQQTSLRLALQTAGNRADAPAPGPTSALGAPSDVLFSATGTLRGEPLQARGRGASVLGLLDDGLAWPLQLEARIGTTTLRAHGRITGLARLSQVDVQLALQGASLARLNPLLGVGLPATGAYATSGRLRREGPRWHYQGFGGKVGRSDVAGSLALDTGAARPLLQGEVRSRLLDLGDLAPVIGLDDDAPGTRLAPGQLWPDLPLKTGGWAQFDADLQLQAEHMLRTRRLPLDSLATRLRLQGGVLTLDGLQLGAAGGLLSGSLTLDARQDTLQASAALRAQGLQLAQLAGLATVVDNPRASVGRVHGLAELRGQGATLGALLASADGRLALVAEPGRISRLLMEQMGLHLVEILRFSLGGDQAVALHCAVADFGVQQGVMTARHLALDTAVNSVTGSGQVDLGRQTLDLTLVPQARRTSLVALRGPIRLHGPLAAPDVQLDAPGIAARSAGALALGLVNPLLALAPLVEPGRNPPSACAKAAAAVGLSPPKEAKAVNPVNPVKAPAPAASAPAPRAAPPAPPSGTRAGTAPPAPPPSRP